MKNKSYLFLTMAGVIVGVIMNMDALVLSGRPTIEMQYMYSVFPFNEFMEYKQYFVSFKIVLASLLYLCFTVSVMKKHQFPYVLLRVKDKYRWEFKLTVEIVKLALLFFLGFTLIIFLMSWYVSDGAMTIYAWITWFLSWISLTYLGIILGCIVNLLAGVVKEKTAVMISYVLFLVGTYGTMQCSDWFASSKLFMYLNPITAISVAEERQWRFVFCAVLGMYIIGFICRSLLAYGYARWEKCVRSEN